MLFHSILLFNLILLSGERYLAINAKIKVFKCEKLFFKFSSSIILSGTIYAVAFSNEINFLTLELFPVSQVFLSARLT